MSDVHPRPAEAVTFIRGQLDQDDPPGVILAHLRTDYHAAVAEGSNGTVALSLCRIRSTCTAGPHGLLTNWLAAAERRLAGSTEG